MTSFSIHNPDHVHQILASGHLTRSLYLQATVTDTWKHPYLVGWAAVIQLVSTADDHLEETFSTKYRIGGFVSKLKKLAATPDFPYQLCLIVPGKDRTLENAQLIEDFTFKDVLNVARVVSLSYIGAGATKKEAFQFPVLLKERLVYEW
jgi:hypothetical protein